MTAFGGKELMTQHGDQAGQAGQSGRAEGTDEVVFPVEYGEPGRWAVVHVHGPLDYYTASVLDATVARLWDFLAGGHLVLDLSPMTFCDSSGLSRIITVFHQCRERGVNLLLAVPPPSLRRILALTGLDRVLQIRDSLHQVLAEVDGPPADGDHDCSEPPG